uniref:Uncharacterized protein n=1 Tax=viral metagenome TaxID=1070528 RepID=A0A6C0KQD2_9ZZZZ
MNIHSFSDEPTSLRQQITYERSYERNIPSQPLQPYLDARPVQTKFSIFPIIDPRMQIQTPLIQQATYSPETVFNPGNDFGPWSGYSSNVNKESELKNQIYANTYCSQASYIPSSNSSLYKINWQNQYRPEQPFPDLFKTEQFCPVNPNLNPNVVGFALFNNSTRSQTKDLTK